MTVKVCVAQIVVLMDWQQLETSWIGGHGRGKGNEEGVLTEVSLVKSQLVMAGIGKAERLDWRLQVQGREHQMVLDASPSAATTEAGETQLVRMVQIPNPRGLA